MPVSGFLLSGHIPAPKSGGLKARGRGSTGVYFKFEKQLLPMLAEPQPTRKVGGCQARRCASPHTLVVK